MKPCDCPACAALLEEVGDEELFGLYARKLLKPGWAGRKSQAEKAYIKARKKPLSEGQRAHLEKLPRVPRKAA